MRSKKSTPGKNQKGFITVKAGLIAGVIMAGSFGGAAAYSNMGIQPQAAASNGSEISNFCVKALSVNNPDISAISGNCAVGNGGGQETAPPKQKNTSNLMETVWDTSIPGCSTIVMAFSGPVGEETRTDWGEGTVDPTATWGRSHNYGDFKGEVKVKVTGTFDTFRVGNGTGKCLISIDSWGSGTKAKGLGAEWELATSLVKVTEIPDTITDFTDLFYGDNWSARSKPLDLSNWDVSQVTSMQRMFQSARNIKVDISGWKPTSLTNMNNMFYDAQDLTIDISQWKLPKVENMSYMFTNSKNVATGLSGWQLGNVTNMSYMFSGSDFNGNISNWDVSSVTNMNGMFASQSKFNNGFPAGSGGSNALGNWNTSNVKNMSLMFWQNDSFNQDIDRWNVEKVTSMSAMFSQASAFAQDLSKWRPRNVDDMSGMFYLSKVTADLSGWPVDSVTDWAGFAEETSLTADKIPSKFADGAFG